MIKFKNILSEIGVNIPKKVDAYKISWSTIKLEEGGYYLWDGDFENKFPGCYYMLRLGGLEDYDFYQYLKIPPNNENVYVISKQNIKFI